VKRLWYFLLGLAVLVIVGTLLFIVIDYEPFKEYQQQLTNYSWFWPALYWSAGVLMFIGLVHLILAFRPSYKSHKLVMEFPDGELQINKKSIEKNVLHTVRQYDAIRQPSIDVKLFQKKQSSFMDVSVDVFVTQVDNAQSYLTQLREDIKRNAERFAELPVREVKLNVLDQKTLKKRVL
jgi:hypothetical protein